MVNYGLKTLKLIIIIINISFFLGMFWLIFCDVTMKITENYQANQIAEFANANHYGAPKDCDALIIKWNK